MFLKKACEERSCLCGNGTVIGPFFYDVNLTGELYLQMLNGSIIPSLELAYNRNQFRHIWFQQDGAPAHRLNTVKAKLREVPYLGIYIECSSTRI